MAEAAEQMKKGGVTSNISTYFDMLFNSIRNVVQRLGTLYKGQKELLKLLNKLTSGESFTGDEGRRLWIRFDRLNYNLMNCLAEAKQLGDKYYLPLTNTNREYATDLCCDYSGNTWVFGFGPRNAVKSTETNIKEDRFNRNKIVVMVVLSELCICVSCMSN